MKIINASLAKSEGWNEMLITGNVYHRDASLYEVPKNNV